MAKKRWLNVDGNVANIANWGGSLPGNDDELQVDRVTIPWDQNLDALAAVTGLLWRFGSQVLAKIGTSSAPLEMGAGATIEFNSPSCPGAFFQPEDVTGDTVIHVLNTSALPGSFTLVGGEVAGLYLLGGRGIYLAGGVVTNLYSLDPNVYATIDAGVTLDTLLDVLDGKLEIAAALPASSNIHGGEVFHRGSNGQAGGSIVVSGSGRCYPEMPNGTYTLLEAKAGGTIEGRRVNVPRTVTTPRIWGRRGQLQLGVPSNNWTLTNPLQVVGANPSQYSTPTGTVTPLAPGGEL